MQTPIEKRAAEALARATAVLKEVRPVAPPLHDRAIQLTSDLAVFGVMKGEVIDLDGLPLDVTPESASEDFSFVMRGAGGEVLRIWRADHYAKSSALREALGVPLSKGQTVTVGRRVGEHESTTVFREVAVCTTTHPAQVSKSHDMHSMMTPVHSMAGEAGVHGHELNRTAGRTSEGGAHCHVFLVEREVVDAGTGEPVLTAMVLTTDHDGAHEHAYEGGDYTQASEGHVHRITLPAGARSTLAMLLGAESLETPIGVELETESDGAHSHQVQLDATAVDGVHRHVLTLPDGSTVTSMNGEEFEAWLTQMPVMMREQPELVKSLADALAKLESAEPEASCVSKQAHVHTLPEGGVTGPGSGDGHQHLLPDGSMTGPPEAGEESGHVHRLPDGSTTGPPRDMASEQAHAMSDTSKLTPGSEPAAPDEQIDGSSVNAPGSAAADGGEIQVSDATRTALENKVAAHNEEHGDDPAKRVTLRMLLAVYRRGAGAFSTSHRPGMTRAQWAMARVNAFLHLLRTGAPKNENYITDNDLLPEDHPRSTRKSDVTRKATQAELDDAYSAWSDAVNMTAGELERWSTNPCSREASVAPAAVIRRNLRLLKTPKSEWTDADVRDSKRTVSFIARHLAQRPGDSGTPARKGCPSARDISLRNWAYDPHKAGDESIPTIGEMPEWGERLETIALRAVKRAPDDGMSREELHEAREERAAEYGIELLDGSALTYPSGFPEDLELYADPVNLKYPVDSIERARNARARFKQFADEYVSPESQRVVHSRIVAAELEFGVAPVFDPDDPLDALLPEDLVERMAKADRTAKAVGRSVRLLKAEPVQEGEERFVFGVVLVPGEVDAQGDTYEAAEVRKAAHGYMQHFGGVLKVMHQGQPVKAARVVETYVTKAPETHGAETFPVGTWLMGTKIDRSDAGDRLWADVLSGDFTGYSIGGTALRESLASPDA